MALTGLRRARTSRAVVEHLVQEIFEGRLRPGDRVDVEQVAAALGVSPTPVREALTLLERDGVVSTRVHRSALVEHFDARTLRADFHVLGMLSGVAVARVARNRDPEVIAELRQGLAELAALPDHATARAYEVATDILRTEHRAGATPRLRAELRGFDGFLNWAARNSSRRSVAQMVEAHTRVIEAIEAGDERRSSELRRSEARATAEEVIEELARRGVIPDGAVKQQAG
ncbi:MAG: GntR family transcriptional regulator [Actinomycetota bacterium]|nr:GntR family transcriptional regulator [Actinomycetota bacterium]